MSANVESMPSVTLEAIETELTPGQASDTVGISSLMSGEFTVDLQNIFGINQEVSTVRQPGVTQKLLARIRGVGSMATDALHETPKHSNQKRRIAAAGLALVALLATDCAFEDASAQERPCFTPLTAAQRFQVNYMIDQQPELITDNLDGTQTVCVLEQTVDGSYVAHEYTYWDRSYFGDYGLYRALNRQTYSYSRFRAIDSGPAVALDNLRVVDDSGRIFRLYEQSDAGGYQRTRTPESAEPKVTQQVYGQRPPVPYPAAAKAKPPKGYEAPPVPEAKKPAASVAPNGEVKPLKSVPANNYQNPSNKGPELPGPSTTATTATRTSPSSTKLVPTTVKKTTPTTVKKPATTVAKPATTAAPRSATTTPKPATTNPRSTTPATRTTSPPARTPAR